jgi:8-oxo-dGTP pyrophosphatase MutT (NUDIX family)
VLALLYPKEGETHIILILRNSYDGTHSGQISFPGGKREPMDKHLHATALREAKEEVNIDPKTVNILGELSQVYIPPSRFIVTPFLGYSLERPNFVPDKHEVAKIIEAPLSLFEGDTHLKQKPMYLNIAKKNIDVKFFDVFGHTVWGATAMMLKEISEILTNDSID